MRADVVNVNKNFVRVVGKHNGAMNTLDEGIQKKIFKNSIPHASLIDLVDSAVIKVIKM